jgi:hypothetical protein
MNQISKYTYWLCVAALFYAAFSFYPKWDKTGTESILSWDVCGYYYYLPATFIYKDLKKVAFHSDLDKKYAYQGGTYYSSRVNVPTGNEVMKYTSGMAVMYAPAFFVAHALAKPLGFEADGFSIPYQLAISFWSVLVAALGLWYLRKVLLKLDFSEKITAFTLFLTVFATNYLDYGSITGTMAHNYIFTLYALLLWFTMKFYETPSVTQSVMAQNALIKSSLGIGFCIGLAALARPTELPIAMLPVFWGIGSMKGISERLAFFKSNWAKIGLAVFSCGAIGFIQLAYWKWTTGHFLYKSYGPEDWMDWAKPHILDGLFSSRKGWLVYTPVMLFAVLGFIPLYKKRRELFWAIGLFTLVFIYISFAHNIWWYGGSLGQRQMVQIYPILALPFAAFLSWISPNKIGQVFLGLASAVCVYLNVWLVYQAHGGKDFELEETTQAFLRATYGRWNVPIETRKLLDNKYDYQGEKRDIEVVYKNGFETDTAQSINNQYVITGKKSLLVNDVRPFSPSYEIPLSNKGKKWLRATATFRSGSKEWTIWRMMQFMLVFKRNGKDVKGHFIRPHRLMSDNETKKIWLDVKIQNIDFDKLVVGFWNVDSPTAMLIDDLEVEVFNE